MKNFFLIAFCFFNYALTAQEYNLGKESIDRIRFTKFYANYGQSVLGKIHFLNKDIKPIKIHKEHQTSFFSEHNLYKYMNAGFKFDILFRTFDGDNKNKHIKTKLAIFIKPFIPLYEDKLSLYATFGGGFGSSLAIIIPEAELNNDKGLFIPSVNAEQSVGINYFLSPRFGLFAQANYVAEINMGNRGNKDNRDLVWFLDHRLFFSGGLSFIF